MTTLRPPQNKLIACDKLRHDKYFSRKSQAVIGCLCNNNLLRSAKDGRMCILRSQNRTGTFDMRSYGLKGMPRCGESHSGLIRMQVP